MTHRSAFAGIVFFMSDPRQYAYVGSQTILKAIPPSSQRTRIGHSDDIRRWIKETSQKLERDKTIIATFIVDLDGKLWIADQRSEHVACAGGQKVLSAGEMTFQVLDQKITVTEVTNQSTGYCPEPESWPIVNAALAMIGIMHPSNFTTAYIFRRCDFCGTTNIVKDDWFECGVCQMPLSRIWNFEEK